jgi:hypothetical protein
MPACQHCLSMNSRLHSFPRSAPPFSKYFLTEKSAYFMQNNVFFMEKKGTPVENEIIYGK